MQKAANDSRTSGHESTEGVPPTYLRKVGDGQYEYGFVRYSPNFRKRPDIYTPAGVRPSVAEAEAARALLAPT